MAKLSALGERKLVEILLGLFNHGEDVGLGDDAAFLPMDDHYLLLTTDVVNQRTHIPEGATPEQVGWYVVAVNFSDIAAMGGQPTGFMAALSLPRTLDLEYLEGLASGMKACVEEYGALVLGGDTKEGPEVSLCGVALGRTRGKRVLRRTGCRPGDLLAVTGTLGRAGWALRELGTSGPSVKVLDVLLKPLPRVAEGLILAGNPAVTACMDISDGLASSLAQLSALNDVSFRVDGDKVPVAASAKGMDRESTQEAVLYEGGDFELLFTASPKAREPLERQFDQRDVTATVIGEVAPPGENTIVVEGREKRLESRGFEHFR